jgi:histidinol-phosphate aminotransferase
LAKPYLKPRAAVEKMAPYHPPTGGRMGKLRLDFNENTVGCSPTVAAALQQAISREGLTVYPEYTATREALARHFGVADDRFLLTNGTDEAIQVLVNTYIDDGGEVLTLHPSYAMYRFYAEVAGGVVRQLPYREPDLAFPLDELVAAITPATRAVLIANPNNPTGTGTDLAGIRRLLEAAPHAAVLIDEAYFEFSGVTVLPWLDEFPQLFVSRTFSKVYGMAALRVGCLFSQAENVKYMHKAQSPYSVNTLAAVAARAAVEDTAYVDAYVAEALAARAMVCDGLAGLGVEYFPSQANFVLFRAGARAIEIRDRLRDAGVLIRDRSYEIAGCVRVTVGTRAQAERFLAELKGIW